MVDSFAGLRVVRVWVVAGVLATAGLGVAVGQATGPLAGAQAHARGSAGTVEERIKAINGLFA